MKVARIEKTGKQAVTLFLITGICLLANKGIVPIGLIRPAVADGRSHGPAVQPPVPDG